MNQMVMLAQGVVALSVAFVWIVRLPNVVKEFHEYGLPDVVRNLVGAVKISLSTLLVVGIWFPRVVFASALCMGVLMLCAQAAHLKARHPLPKYLPSLALLLLCVFICCNGWGSTS